MQVNAVMRLGPFKKPVMSTSVNAIVSMVGTAPEKVSSQ
jgi:hypothetical protein